MSKKLVDFDASIYRGPVLCVTGSYSKVYFLDPETLEVLFRLDTDGPRLNGTNLRCYVMWDNRIVVSTRGVSDRSFPTRDLFFFDPCRIDSAGDKATPIHIDSKLALSSGTSEFVPAVQDVRVLGDSGRLIAGATNGHLVVLDSDGQVLSACGCEIAGSNLVDLRTIHRFGSGYDDWSSHVYVGTQKCLSLWDLEKSTCIQHFRSLENHLDLVEGIGASLDTEMVFSAGIDKHLSVFPRNLNERIQRIRLSNNGNSVLHCDDLHLIMVGCYMGKVQIFDPRKLDEELSSVDVLGATGMFAMTRLTQSKFVSVGTNAEVGVFDILKMERTGKTTNLPDSGAHYGACGFPEFRTGQQTSRFVQADLVERVDFLLGDEAHELVVSLGSHVRIVTLGSAIVMGLYWLYQ